MGYECASCRYGGIALVPTLAHNSCLSRDQRIGDVIEPRPHVKTRRPVAKLLVPTATTFIK